MIRIKISPSDGALILTLRLTPLEQIAVARGFECETAKLPDELATAFSQYLQSMVGRASPANPEARP